MYLFCISCKKIVAAIKVPTLVLGEDLFGFKRGKGTTDAVGMMMIRVPKRTYRQRIGCVLTEWQITLERVNWTKLMPILKGTCIN